MKKAAVILTAVITAFLGGCTVYEITEATTAEESREAETTAIVVVVPDTTEAIATEMSDVAVTGAGDTEETTVLPEETSAEQTTTAEEKTTAGEKTTAEEKTTKKEEKTTKEDKTTANSFEEVELSISMPEKNGTMVTDDSPNNKYIKIVNKEKKINKDLLLAVYSVPESGQNYVFEFYDAENSDADNIRRVYLIDSDGKISSVAATENAERVNISPVENWFCMNVLIKEIIYPAVSSGR